VRVWARYSDRMRAVPIIAFIVADPRIKEGTLDERGPAIQRIGPGATLADSLKK
jgi:hypothetical protein